MTNSAMRVLFGVAAVVALTLTISQPSVDAQSNKAVCKGVYDVYFVLDRTGSMNDDKHSWRQLVQFVNGFMDAFQSNPLSRFFFVTFAEDARIECKQANGDPANTYAQGKMCIQNTLSQITPIGGTWIGGGLDLANGILKQRQAIGNVPLFLLATDGSENCVPDGGVPSTRASSMSRKLGANMYVIGLESNDLSPASLKQLAGPSGKYYQASTAAQQLNSQLQNDIASAMCTEIGGMTGLAVCIDQVGKAALTVSGSMLVDRKTQQPKIRCSFLDLSVTPPNEYVTSDADTIVVAPNNPDSSDVQCRIPAYIQKTGTYKIVLSLKGGTASPYSTMTQTLVVKDCALPAPPPPPKDVMPRVVSLVGQAEFCNPNDTLSITLFARNLQSDPALVCDCYDEDPAPEDGGSRSSWPHWSGTAVLDQTVPASSGDSGRVDTNIICTFDGADSMKTNKQYYVYVTNTKLNMELPGRGSFGIKECVETSAVWPYVAAGAFAMSAVMMWFWWPYLVGTPVYKPKAVQEGVAPASVEESKPAPPPPPKNAPPRKWGVVDASKYIWARDGGTARPINVKWGEMGPTAMGGNIEAAGELDDDDVDGSGTKKNGAGGDYDGTGGDGDGGNGGKNKKVTGFSNGRTNCCFGCMACCVATMSACWEGTYGKCADMRPKRYVYRSEQAK